MYPGEGEKSNEANFTKFRTVYDVFWVGCGDQKPTEPLLPKRMR